MEAFMELFSTEGRANRAWYFWHVLLDDLAIGMAFVLLVVVGAVTESLLFIPPLLALLVAGIWAACAVTVKRLHDLERPGWHLLLFLVPLYNFWLGLVLLFKRGTEGPNLYGPDPLRLGPGGWVED